jgi:hypothetical protein
MKKLITTLLLATSFWANAQNLAGYWYGVAYVGTGTSANSYLIELIINQNGNTVNGIVNYYFRNTFRSFKTNGSYSENSRQLSLYNIPVTFHGSNSRMEVDCPMDFIAQLRVARAGSNLNGRFVSKENYRYTCPDIIFDLQLNKDANNQDSILTALRQFKETYQVWTPSATDTLVAAVVQQRPITNFVVNNQFKQRENIVLQEIEVEADSVRVDLYDNGEVDGDSISLFFNDKLLASTQRLSTKAIHMDLKLDSLKEFNEIAMFADNLGSIPPNTALMIVYDGRQRHEIRLSSNLNQNGVLRIKKKKKTSNSIAQ